MYNDELSTACGSLQTLLILQGLSLLFNDAEEQERRKKRCHTLHSWAFWLWKNFPNSLIFRQTVVQFGDLCVCFQEGDISLLDNRHYREGNKDIVQEKKNLCINMNKLQTHRLRSATAGQAENQGHA